MGLKRLEICWRIVERSRRGRCKYCITMTESKEALVSNTQLIFKDSKVILVAIAIYRLAGHALYIQISQIEQHSLNHHFARLLVGVRGWPWAQHCD